MAQADATAEEVATLRGLPLKEPLQRDVRTREQLRDFLVQAMSEDYTPAQIEAESLTFKSLGLLPQSIDYGELILDLLTSEIAGFYDPKVKQLYIMTGLAQAVQGPTMAHEIFHALQDQHYDLLALQGPFDPLHQSDFSLARSALFEGDATVLMLDYDLHQQGRLPSPQESGDDITTIAMNPALIATVRPMTLSGVMSMEQMFGAQASKDPGKSGVQEAPAIIRESLLFPYLAGLRFTLLAYAELGSWKAFQDQLYAQAPVSTEQIIHPERYFANDLPTMLEFNPDGALPTYTRIYDNVLGEFQMHLAIRQHVQFARPKGAPLLDVNVDEALKGWGGDRLLTYKSSDAHIITIHLSTWDTIADAKEYGAALNSALRTRHHDDLSASPSASAHMGDASYFVITSSSTLTYVERWGDTVLHIEGIKAPEDVTQLASSYAPLKALRDATYSSLERRDFMTQMKALQDAKQSSEP